MKSAIVIGAGFAGLAAALELARSGLAVSVFEASDRPGGRAQELVSPDRRFRFDMGPTILTMTDALQRSLGAAAFSALRMQRLEPGYRVLWPDGGYFDMHSDVALWLAEIARYRTAGAGDALAYLAMMHEQFVESRARILETECTKADLAALIFKPGKLRPWVMRSLQQIARRHFVHPRLVEAVTFQTLYLGLTPSRSPAVYGLLMAEEVVGGIWHPPGGIAAIVNAFVAECERFGVRFHFNSPAARVVVDGRRATAVVAGGKTYATDAVIVAADRERALRELLTPKASRKRLRYGHSAIVFYLGLEGALDVRHHVVLMPSDPASAYDQLDRGRVPDDLLLYVCHPGYDDPRATPGALSVLVPVPNRAALPEIDEEALFARVIQRLEHHYGALAERIVYRHYRGPRELESELGLAHGAAFGPSHHLAQMGPFRPSIAFPGASNVAFAGSGTRPGSGVPMVLISGRLAAEHVLRAVA